MTTLLTSTIAHAMRPCTGLAGDAVGVVGLPHGQVGLYLLDVSGHGVGAALLSFTLNHMLSPSVEGALLIEATADGLSVVSPSRVAERLNRQFPMDRTRQYFTFVYGVFEPSMLLTSSTWVLSCPSPAKASGLTASRPAAAVATMIPAFFSTVHLLLSVRSRPEPDRKSVV